MIERSLLPAAKRILDRFPAFGLLGSRQVGKTTLAKSIVSDLPIAILLDLESPADIEKLENPETFLNQFSDRLIVIDEVQRMPDLFPVLRSVIDKDRRNGRFILLGSASPGLIRNSSESLAGRIAYLELGPFNLSEVSEINKLWLSGGYPESYLHLDTSDLWLENYIRSYVERDLPQLGFNANPIFIRRLWTMLAHLHGQTVNYSEIAKALDTTGKKIKSYIDFLEQAYLIRQLRPYHLNTKKRLVKSPKVYLRDSGVLHHLLGVSNEEGLFGHPKMGASWEGFVIEQITQHLQPGQQLYFFRTQDRAELDLVIERNGVVTAGVEIKFGDKANVSRGNTEAANELSIKNRFVITANSDEWEMANGFKVTNLKHFLRSHLPQL